MRFRLTEGNFIRIGAYKEGNTAVFTFAAQKEDECNIVLTDIAQKKKYNIDDQAKKKRVPGCFVHFLCISLSQTF